MKKQNQRVVKMTPQDWKDRRKENKIMEWLTGLAKESGLEEWEEVPMPVIFDININFNNQKNE